MFSSELLLVLFYQVLLWSLGHQVVGLTHPRLSYSSTLAVGFFVGQLAGAACIWFLGAIGIPWSRVSVLSGLLIALIAVTYLRYKLRRRASLDGFSTQNLRHLPHSFDVQFTCVILLSLLVWRQYTLFSNLGFEPLLAWDTWMNWLPKARVWFDLGTPVEWVPWRTWLVSDAPAYTLGNKQASTYPEFVPYLLLGGLVFENGHVTPSLFVGWWLAPLCLSLLFYSELREAGVSVLISFFGAYALQSLPLINVHTLLSGYADLWLTSFFSIGLLSLFRFWRRRSRPDAAMLTCCAAACIATKNPGLYAGAILMMALAVSVIQPRISVGLVLGGLATLVFVSTFVFVYENSMNLGFISIEPSRIQVEGLDEFLVEAHPLHTLLPSTLWASDLWHLSAALFAMGLASFMLRFRQQEVPWPVLIAILGVLAAQYFIFGFTHYYERAVTGVTLSRSLMVCIPGMLFVGIWALHLNTRNSFLRSSPAGKV